MFKFLMSLLLFTTTIHSIENDFSDIESYKIHLMKELWNRHDFLLNQMENIDSQLASYYILGRMDSYVDVMRIIDYHIDAYPRD